MRALVPDLGHLRHAARRAGMHLSAQDRLPELYYSEQARDKPAGAHAEYVTGRGLLRFCEEVEVVSGGREVVSLVEAKRKDLAIARAVAELPARQRARLEALVPDLAAARRARVRRTAVA
jgi:UV DNA damage endonuclease